MAAKPLPSPEVLRQLLRYEPDTGKLFWLPRPRDMFNSDRSFNTWNARFAGAQALIVANNGYRKGRIFGCDQMAHRVVWAIAMDVWPTAHIDHINGDRSDNRMANLREATPSENMRNRGHQSNNTAGLKGVHWCERSRMWISKIQVEGKPRYLGCFSSPESAHAAYCEAAKCMHGEFARLA